MTASWGYEAILAPLDRSREYGIGDCAGVRERRTRVSSVPRARTGVTEVHSPQRTG
jgi:hypothetical protein